MRKFIFGLALMIVCGMIVMSVPPPASYQAIPAHIETSFAVGNYTCLFPSAKNSSYLLGAGTPSSPALGYQIWDDGITWPDLYATSFPRTAAAYTNDFTKTEWHGPISNLTPPAGAVITVMTIDALFLSGGPATGLPAGYSLVGDWRMAFSITTPASYIDVGAPTPVDYGISNYGQFQYGLQVNITGLESWTVAMLRSSDLSVRLTFTVPAYLTFYLDYLGIYYWFYVPPGIGTTPGDSNVTWPAPTSIWGGDLTIVGFAGLFGLVAAAPIGLVLMKRADSKGKVFLGTLLFAAFCYAIMTFGFG